MAAPSSTSFPIIDISHIDDADSQRELAEEITRGCSQWGFLLLKGHPIPSTDIEEMFSLGKDFFTLPEEDKTPYPITSKSIGYVGSFQDRGKDDKMSMWFGGVPGALDDNRSTVPPFWHPLPLFAEVFCFQRLRPLNSFKSVILNELSEKRRGAVKTAPLRLFLLYSV